MEAPRALTSRHLESVTNSEDDSGDSEVYFDSFSDESFMRSAGLMSTDAEADCEDSSSVSTVVAANYADSDVTRSVVRTLRIPHRAL